VLIKLEAQIFSIHHLVEKKLDQKEAMIHKPSFYIYQGKNNIYDYICEMEEPQTQNNDNFAGGDNN